MIFKHRKHIVISKTKIKIRLVIVRTTRVLLVPTSARLDRVVVDHEFVDSW